MLCYYRRKNVRSYNLYRHGHKIAPIALSVGERGRKKRGGGEELEISGTSGLHRGSVPRGADWKVLDATVAADGRLYLANTACEEYCASSARTAESGYRVRPAVVVACPHCSPRRTFGSARVLKLGDGSFKKYCNTGLHGLEVVRRSVKR